MTRYLVFGIQTNRPDRTKLLLSREERHIHFREFLGFTAFHEFYFFNNPRVTEGDAWEFAVFPENARVSLERKPILPEIKVYHHFPANVKYDWAYTKDRDYFPFGNEEGPKRMKPPLRGVDQGNVVGADDERRFRPPVNMGLNPFQKVRHAVLPAAMDAVVPTPTMHPGFLYPIHAGNQCRASVDKYCGDDVQSHYVEWIYLGKRLIRTNGIPNHPYHHAREMPNPNQACEQLVEFQLPLFPKRRTASQPAPTGITGVLKTGGFIFSPFSSRDNDNDIAMHHSIEGLTLDACDGHADPFCHYHYHGVKKNCIHDCVFEACKLIGWMVDGFPLYSACGELKSCYHFKPVQSDSAMGDDSHDYVFDPVGERHGVSCDLDDANGVDFTNLELLDNFGVEITGYGYVATEEYPFVPPRISGEILPMYEMESRENIPLNNPVRCPTFESNQLTTGSFERSAKADAALAEAIRTGAANASYVFHLIRFSPESSPPHLHVLL